MHRLQERHFLPRKLHSLKLELLENAGRGDERSFLVKFPHLFSLSTFAINVVDENPITDRDTERKKSTKHFHSLALLLCVEIKKNKSDQGRKKTMDNRKVLKECIDLFRIEFQNIMYMYALAHSFSVPILKYLSDCYSIQVLKSHEIINSFHSIKNIFIL